MEYVRNTIRCLIGFFRGYGAQEMPEWISRGLLAAVHVITSPMARRDAKIGYDEYLCRSFRVTYGHSGPWMPDKNHSIQVRTQYASVGFTFWNGCYIVVLYIRHQSKRGFRITPVDGWTIDVVDVPSNLFGLIGDDYKINTDGSVHVA